MNRTIGWIVFRWFASIFAVLFGVLGIFAAAGDGNSLAVVACAVVVVLAPLWQWDRDQGAEVDHAVARHQVARQAVHDFETSGTGEKQP